MLKKAIESNGQKYLNQHKMIFALLANAEVIRDFDENQGPNSFIFSMNTLLKKIIIQFQIGLKITLFSKLEHLKCKTLIKIL